MPFAKPTFLAQLLRHMSQVSGRSPRNIVETAGPKWARVREMLDVMSDERFGAPNLDFYSPDAGRAKVASVVNTGKIPYSLVTHYSGQRLPPDFEWTANPGSYKAELLHPYESLFNPDYPSSNASVLVHENEHFQWHNRPDNKRIKKEGSVYTYTTPEVAAPYEIGEHSQLKDLHPSFDRNELNSILMEGAAAHKASRKYGVDPAEYVGGWKDDLLPLFERMPEWVRESLIKKVAVGGVALPTIGAYQPETQE